MKDCVDLHVHSVFSDGTLTPDELVCEAVKNGLSALALTDHNTVAGLPDFLAAAERSGKLEAIAGTEVSTSFEGIEFHILGLFLPDDSLPALEARFAFYREKKAASNRKLVEALRAAGYVLPDGALDAKPGASVNRANIASALVKAGYFATVKETFGSVLKKGGGFYEPPERPDAAETVGFLRSVGAVPVWAHPMLDADEETARRFLDRAVGAGLAGMEVLYSDYDGEMEALAGKLCAEYGLLPSGGSDFHGANKQAIRLGCGHGDLAVPLRYAEALKSAGKAGKSAQK